MRLMKTRWLLAVAAAAALTVGCESMGMKKKDDAKTSSAKMEAKTLYARLGGEPAIKAVCADFVGRAAANPDVNFFRKGVPDYPEWKPSADELAMFNKHLVQFVCMAAGGPQKYEGETMKDSHKGMKITEAQFNAIAGDLSASLDKFKVPAKEKGELLAAVAATKPDIVEMK